MALLNAQDARPFRGLEKSTSVASQPVAPGAAIQSAGDNDMVTATTMEGIKSMKNSSMVGVDSDPLEKRSAYE
ncbi:MAG: hypothetical protein ABI650_06010 [Dokdonella sp.]